MAPSVADAIAASLAAIQREMPAPTGDLGYGTDVMSLQDLDDRARDIDPTGTDGITQDCFHRLDTPRGLIRDAPDFGLDLVGLLHGAMTTSSTRLNEGAVIAELRKDDRVADAEVTISQVAHSSWRIAILITPEDPSIKPFPLVLALTDGKLLLDTMASNTG